MSLASQITSLASRIATEVKAVRAELATGLSGKASTSHTHALTSLTDTQVSAPSSGQALTYNGTKWVNGSVGGGLSVSDTAPTSPTSGQQWLDSSSGRTYVYYDNFWIEQDTAGTQGPQGLQGADGAQGASGSSGVVSVTSPITNSGSSSSASLGLNVSAISGSAPSLAAGSLTGGTNLSTYTNMAAISANTNTKIASFSGLENGMYALFITWGTGYDSSGTGTIYWNSGYAGLAGLVSTTTYYNSSPQQQLTVTSTQHHRTVGAPTFWLYSDSTAGAYGALCLWVNFPQITKLDGLVVVAKRLY